MSGVLNHLCTQAAPWSLAMLLTLLSPAAPGPVHADDGGESYPPGWVPAPGGYPPPPPAFTPMVGPQYPGAAPRTPGQPPADAPARRRPQPPQAGPQPPQAAPQPAAAVPPAAAQVPSQPPDAAQQMQARPAPEPASASAMEIAEPPSLPEPPAAPAVASQAVDSAYPDVAGASASGGAAAAAGGAGAAAGTQQVAAADTAGGSEAAAGITSGDSPECMRCHWMETLAYRDRDTREIVNLSVDREAYKHSVHNELACRDCHDRGYKHYPHRTTSADEGLQCVECHAERQGDEDHQPPKLDGFDIQYHDSVHAKQDDEPFSCFSCHNPHEFRPLPNDTPVPQVVAANNNLCLDCHTELRSPVPKGHDWLPQPQRHWASVRCIDCHTPVEGRDLYAPSHELLGAEDSNQNCVECHSQGGQLLAQLYVHRAEQEREQEGFFSHAIYNDAYIIGMSRSPLIDLIGLAVVGLMILGIGAHGYGRYLAYKKYRKPEQESQ